MFTLIGTTESYGGRRGVLYIANDEILHRSRNSIKSAPSGLDARLISQIKQLKSDNDELIEMNEHLRREVANLQQKQRNTA